MIVRMMQLAAVVAALWLVAIVSAQQPPAGPPLAAWSVPTRDEPMMAARAWFVASDGARDFVLFEAPPRGEVAAAPEAAGAEQGTLRPASGLQLMPEVMAAVDDAVFMVFSKGVSGFPLEVRNVLRARSAYLGDRWVTVPAGRFDAEPPLPATGLPVAAAGVRGRLGVLMLGVANAEQLGLMVLEGREWRTFPVPQDALMLARRTSERRGST